MPIDIQREELEALRIDRSDREHNSRPKMLALVYLVGGIAIAILLAVRTVAFRKLSPEVVEVEVTRAIANDGSGLAVALSASGYIIPHHKINVNSKVTGRVEWIGVEKGDKVKEGQVLVRLEDDEFQGQYQQATGAFEGAKARLQQLTNGSRPEEIEQARYTLAQARAVASNDRATLDRTRELAAQGVLSKQALDDAAARFEADQQRANALEQSLQLVKIGPRREEIDRARADLVQAKGQLAFAKSQLDATSIRAPVGGTVLERRVEKGELVTAQFASGAEGGPQGSVVALADLNDLQVELDIAQDDFARLGFKQKCVVITDAFPDRRYDGRMTEISPEANRQKATVQIKVQILRPDDYLRPEMNATVQFLSSEIVTDGGSDGVLIPAAAVHDRNGKKKVFIAMDGRAVSREVRVMSQSNKAYVVEGLKVGDNIILTAPGDLKDGTKVRVKGAS